MEYALFLVPAGQPHNSLKWPQRRSDKPHYAACTALRVYALLRSFPLCSAVFVLAMVPFAVNFVRPVSAQLSTSQTPETCQDRFSFGLMGARISPFGCVGIDRESLELNKT